MFRARFNTALRPTLKHLACSLLVAAAASALVFTAWYPYPYREISGGRELFVILMTVDVVIGPLLTLVVFNPTKPRSELVRDLSVVVMLQTVALGYGLCTVYAARPVVLAFEGNRFRVVSAAELDHDALGEAPEALRQLSNWGPRLISVRLLEPSDPGYVESLKQALGGLSPTHRPSRWRLYKEQSDQVAAGAKRLSELIARKPEQARLLEDVVNRSPVPRERLGYWPLQSRTKSDWIVIVDKQNGQPLAYAPVDAW